MEYTVQKNKKDVTYLMACIILVASVAVLINCFGNGISGNDFWWHVKAGEWMCREKKIPSTDIFSWYGIQKQLQWTSHEWLSEVILFLIYHYAGECGIYLFALCSALIMLVLLWRHTQKYIEKNVLISVVFFITFSIVFYCFFYGRPQLFSFFLLYFELKCLYTFWENENSGSIYVIPIIACLWSNLHGGSSNLSYLLCMIVLVAGSIPWKIGCIYANRFSVRSSIRLVCVTLLSAGAIILNPVGVNMLLYPYVNMRDDFMLSMISEWSAPDAKNVGELILYFLPIGLMLIGFFAEKEKIDWLDLLIMGFFLLLFLRSVRFIILWDIAACFCAFRYMPLCRVKEITRKWEKGLVMLAGILLCLLLGSGVKEIYETCRTGNIISKEISEEIINEIKQDNPKRLLNDYNLGGELIFHDIRVFVDGRADLYAQEHILRDVASLMYLVPAEEETGGSVESLLEKYQFDSVIMQKNRAFYTYMKSHPEQFELIREDEDNSYFRVKSAKRAEELKSN